tara:strand:+ start:311 stop:1057 length:747 start_codon:yes stop_codon:yes gene_type:complete
MQNMLVFHNAGDTSYANFAGNLSSMSSSTTAVTLRFLGQGASVTATSTDVVVLTVTAGQEENVMEALSGLLGRGSNNKSGMTVVADDQNSKYVVDGITAVNSISVDSGAGTFKNIKVGLLDGSGAAGTGMDTAHDITLTTAESGTLLTVPTTGAASTITIPQTSIPDGTNYRFVCEADSGAHTITLLGAFEGQVDINDAGVLLDNTTNIVIAASDFKIGDWFEIVYTGAAGGWKISGAFATAAAIAAN